MNTDCVFRHLRLQRILARPMQRLAHGALMKIAELKRIPHFASPGAPVRGTEGQDAAIAHSNGAWHKNRRWYATGAGALALILLFIWLVHAWVRSNHVVSVERLRIVSVTLDCAALRISPVPYRLDSDA